MWQSVTVNSEAKNKVKQEFRGISLVDQLLGFCAFTAGVLGLIPGWETKILQVVHCSPNKQIQSQAISKVASKIQANW